MFIRKNNISKNFLTEFKPCRFHLDAFSFPNTNGDSDSIMAVENLEPLSQSHEISCLLRWWSNTPLHKTRETHLFSPNNKTFLTTSVYLSSTIKHPKNVFIQSLQQLNHLLFFQTKQKTKTLTSLLLNLTKPAYWSNSLRKTQEKNFRLPEKSSDKVYYWTKSFINLTPIIS